MKILIATPEAVPFAKTGGLADVTGALLNEYRKMKEEAYLVMPLYGRVRENFKLKDTGLKISVPLGNKKLKAGYSVMARLRRVKLQHILLSAMSSLTEKRFTAHRAATIPTMRRDLYFFQEACLKHAGPWDLNLI